MLVYTFIKSGCNLGEANGSDPYCQEKLNQP